MSEGRGRKPETLFGSGQKNANRKGRGPARDRTMAEIGQMKLRCVSKGQIRTTTLDEEAMMKLYVLAAKGDRHALAEIMMTLSREAEAAILRKPSRRPDPEQLAALRSTLRPVVESFFGAMFETRKQLAQASVIHEVDGEWFVSEWAAQLAYTQKRSRYS